RLPPGASRAGGSQGGTTRAPVARPVCRGRGAEVLYHGAAQGTRGEGADAALRAYAARPGLSLCGGGRGAGAPPGGRCAARPASARGRGGHAPDRALFTSPGSIAHFPTEHLRGGAGCGTPTSHRAVWSPGRGTSAGGAARARGDVPPDARGAGAGPGHGTALRGPAAPGLR